MNRLNFVSEGTRQFFRGRFRTFASIVILVSSLLLVGVFATVMIVINKSVENIDDFNKIVVYMKLDTQNEQVNAAKKQIESLKNVKSVRFISKADALSAEKVKFGEDYAYIFDSYDDSTNPLPDSFEIEYEDINGVDALVYNLERLDADGDGKDDGIVDKVKNRYDIAKNINNFKNVISISGTWLMTLLIALSVFVISNTIRLTYHSRELEVTVMRYIGATKTYITMPFMFEGALIGLVSGLIGYGVQYYIYCGPITNLASKLEGYIILPPFEEINPLYLAIYFGAGLVLGIFGSAIAIRRFMKA